MKKALTNVTICSLFALLFCSYITTANAADDRYQAEISAFYTHEKASDDFKMDMTGIIGEIFFAPVNTKDHPYAEAAFLERIGSVSVGTFLADIKGTSSTADGTSSMAGVNIARPGFPLAVELMYGTSKFEYDSDATYKTKGYEVKIGNYFTDHLFAGIALENTKADMSNSLFTMTVKTREYGLFGRYVTELKGKHLSLEGNIGQSKLEDDIESEKNTAIALNVDYFFNRALSTGVGIEKNSGDSKTEEGMNYAANARYFLTPRVSIQLSYDRFLNSNPGFASVWSYDIAAAVRF